MRPDHPRNLRVATRGTAREINRAVVLNLIRLHQPISRADLARHMGTRRGAVSVLVNQLIEEGEVFEGATGEAKRGRKPTFLYMDSRERCVVAVDIRRTRTFVMVTDLLGRQLASVTSYPTERDPKRFVAGLAKRINAILAGHRDIGRCEGVGVVVPRMVDTDAGRVLSAPNLGWRDLLLRDALAAAVGRPVEIENSGRRARWRSSGPLTIPGRPPTSCISRCPTVWASVSCSVASSYGATTTSPASSVTFR